VTYILTWNTMATVEKLTNGNDSDAEELADDVKTNG
jgi:hypothetical protein